MNIDKRKDFKVMLFQGEYVKWLERIMKETSEISTDMSCECIGICRDLYDSSELEEIVEKTKHFAYLKFLGEELYFYAIKHDLRTDAPVFCLRYNGNDYYISWHRYETICHRYNAAKGLFYYENIPTIAYEDLIGSYSFDEIAKCYDFINLTSLEEIFNKLFGFHTKEFYEKVYDTLTENEIVFLEKVLNVSCENCELIDCPSYGRNDYLCNLWENNEMIGKAKVLQKSKF